MLMYLSLPHFLQLQNSSKAKDNLLGIPWYYVFIFVMVAYLPGFYVLYTRMFGLRRKNLGNSSKAIPSKGKKKKN